MAIILSENLKWTGKRQNNINGFLISAEDIGFYKPNGEVYSLKNNEVLTIDELLTYVSTTNNNLINNYYDKNSVDIKFNNLIDNAPENLNTLKEIADVLRDNPTISQVDEALNKKANKEDVYTKQEVDNSLSNKYNKTEVYTKQEVDNSLSNKYNKTEVYTKQEVDNIINDVRREFYNLINEFHPGYIDNPYSSFNVQNTAKSNSYSYLDIELEEDSVDNNWEYNF